MLSSCRVRIASRGSKGRGTPAAVGTRRMRTAASAGTLETQKLHFLLLNNKFYNIVHLQIIIIIYNDMITPH